MSADLQCVSSVFVSRVAPQGGGGSLVVERPTAGHVPGALWPFLHQKIHSPVVLQNELYFFKIGYGGKSYVLTPTQTSEEIKSGL